VETETAELWDDYDKYTLAIAPLEDLLLKLSLVVDSESTAWLPIDTKIIDLISSVQTWQDRRKDLRALDGFYSNKHLKDVKDETTDSDAKSFHFRDDLTFLNALCKGISGLKESIQLKISTHVKNADNIVPKINGTTADESIEQIIRSAMLVYGVMAVFKGGLEADDCKAHLKSKRMWTEVQGLLSSVVEHLSASKDVATLKSKVEAFIAFLKTFSGAKLPSSYWELRKAVQKVRRPYHAQTLAAVRQARQLAEHFSKLKADEQTSAILQPLEDAIDAVTAAISDAASKITSVLSLKATDTQLVDTAFVTAKQKLDECFTKYKITATTGTSLADAKTEDDKYVTEINKHFKDGLKTRSASTSVNVELIRVKADASEDSKTYSMDDSTQLSAILWKEAGSDSTVKLENSHFKLKPSDADDKKIDLETQVRSIVESAGKRTVYLIG